MKKNCFLAFIVVFTILVASILYVAQKYGDRLLGMGKEFVVGKAEQSLLKEIDKLKNVEYSDSLKAVMEDYFLFLKQIDVESITITDEGMKVNKYEDVIKYAKRIIEDKEINLSEINKLKFIIKEQKEDYEKSKKN